MVRSEGGEKPGSGDPESRDARAGGPGAHFGRNLAVTIGIDAYGDGIMPLRSAVADARAIADALERDHGFEAWRRFDDGARLSQLLELLEQELPAALGPDDRLLLYFAGHGIALDGDAGPAGYLVPAGARATDRCGFLPMQRLHAALARLPVRHALVILDCCFAGSFRWSSLRDVEPAATRLYRERYDRYLERAAWQVLTSTSADELALDSLASDRGEGAGSHSPFALALLEGLSSCADYTGDHLITADELAMFVRERVAPTAEGIGRRQIPQLFPLDRHDGGQFLFQVPNRTPILEPAPPLDKEANPYRGLQRYGERHRAMFFGRDAVTKRLVDAVAARPFTAVVGPSGSGKSSLIHAGLVPAVRARGWKVLASQRPGRRPLGALAALTQELRAPADAARPGSAWLAAATQREGQGPWLVIIDQLEELLTPRTAPRDRAAFLEALDLALEAAPSLHLVVVVRSDAEARLLDTALGPRWAAGRFAVPAMTRDELRDVIEKPAAAEVVHLESSRLVERMLDDIALVQTPLPLLSFALSELYRRCWKRWQQGERDRVLREADYDAMGGVAGALTRRATVLHDQLVAKDPAHATTIRNLFTRMTAVVNGEVTRRRVPGCELEYDDPAENRRVAEVLHRFEGARLISRGTEKREDGVPCSYAEPIHDALVRNWALVGGWLDELDDDAGTRALLGELSSSAHAWQGHGMDDAYLWHDPRAERAERLECTRWYLLNAREALFVRCSARVRRRRQHRRRRHAWMIAGLLAIIAVLAVTTGIAMWRWSAAVAKAAEVHDGCIQPDAAPERAAAAHAEVDAAPSARTREHRPWR